MSIIESAFLKTLKQKKSQSEKESTPTVVKATDNSDEEIYYSKTKVDYSGVDYSDVSVQHPSSLGISSMSQKRRYSNNELAKLGIISAHSPDQKLVNEYRNLRTNLIAGQKKKNFTTLVTCIVPDYDISYIVANIAAAFALDANKTSLIINADIKSHELDQLFDTNINLGVIDYLETENIGIEDVLYETPIARLRYIPSGDVREDTSEYFTSMKMKKLVSALLERYPERFPIIQAPSIGSSADTRILADSCDCVILVCPYAKCNEGNIEQAMRTVESNNFAGVVLSDFS